MLVQKILVAGAAGSLGFEVMKKLRQMNVPVRALGWDKESVEKLRPYTDDVVIWDAGKIEGLEKILNGIHVVFSSLGQSVSLFSKGSSFEKIGFGVNQNLINASEKSGVRRFVYISIKGADAASSITIANVHKRVEDLLIVKKMNHTIIRAVGLFCGFHDWLIMGKQGAIPVAGSGEHKTNPIHVQDLAQVAVDSMFHGPEVMEVGGPYIFTRNEIAHMVHEKTGGKILHIPVGFIEPGLLFVKYIDHDIQAKLDYFKFVSTNDMVAPQYGKISLADYIKDLDLNHLPNAW